MATDQAYLLTFILVMASATFATRAVPFVFFSKSSRHGNLKFLAENLPAMVGLPGLEPVTTDLRFQGFNKIIPFISDCYIPTLAVRIFRLAHSEILEFLTFHAFTVMNPLRPLRFLL